MKIITPAELTNKWNIFSRPTEPLTLICEVNSEISYQNTMVMDFGYGSTIMVNHG